MFEKVFTEEVVREIAEKIVHEQILENWLFYFIVFAITLVSSAISSFVASRYKKSGEIAAITANIDTLNKQLETQTIIVKNIETEISFSDWKAREWNSLRRVKLEELLDAASSGQQWLTEQAATYQKQIVLFRGAAQIALQTGDATKLTNMEEFKIEFPAEISKVGNLTHLYFSELIEEWEKYEQVYLEFFSRIPEIQSDLIGSIGESPEQFNMKFEQANTDIRKQITKLILATKTIRNKASTLVKEIMKSD